MSADYITPIEAAGASLDALADSMFSILPYVFCLAVGGLVVVHVIVPVVDDMITARQAGRKEQREREANAEQRKALAASEITVRGDFDDWLEAEALRLQIDCLAYPQDKGRADALAAVEAAKAENAARIVALHQDDGTPAASPQAVKQQWERLRAMGAIPQTRAA